MNVTFDTSGLRAGLEKRIEMMNAARRPAAQAAAQVIYDAARVNVPVSAKGHWFHGTQFRVNGTKYYFDAGSLRDAIYQVYSADNSGPLKDTYHVAWNHRKVPYGFMVEFGTSRAPAHSFLGPAIHDNEARAQQVMTATFLERVNQ